MLRQIFQRMIRSKQEICRDIFKVCCDIKSEVSIARHAGYIAIEKFYVATATTKC